MPRVKCEGIATLIHRDLDAGIQFDKDNKFYVIPRSLATRYVKHSSVPLLLEHNKKFTVGYVDNFYVADKQINGQKRPVLVADFTIDNESFISVLQEASAFRFQEITPTSYVSTDRFVCTEDTNANAKLDLTAHEALLQRLPGLSLSHDVNNFDIVELSLVVAGARPGTVVTRATYDVETDGRASNEEEKNLYRTFFAGLHAMSNGFRCKKVEADLKALDMPTTCLVYSKVGKGEEDYPITEDGMNKVSSNTMDQPPQHNVPLNFSEHMREMLENTLSRYLGTPQKSHTTTPQLSGYVLPQIPPNYYCANDYYRNNNKRKKRHAANDYNEDSCSDSEEDDRSTHKRSKRSSNRKGCQPGPSDSVLHKQLDDVKEQLKMLAENIPKSAIPVAPSPVQQPNLADQLGELFHKKIKDVIFDVQQQQQQQQQQTSPDQLGELFDRKIKDVISHMQQQQKQQQSWQTLDSEAEKSPMDSVETENETSSSKKVSQKTDKYSSSNPIKTPQDHLKAKLDDSYIFAK